jgi:DNA repair protein RadC
MDCAVCDSDEGEQALHFMVSSVPACDGALPLRQGESGNRAIGVRNYEHTPVLRSHSDPVHRGVLPSQESETIRLVSFVANLLTPFASERAERAAKNLVQAFGGLDNALHASDERLRKALGQDEDLAAYLIGAQTLVEGSIRERIASRPVSTDDQELILFLQRRLHSPREERFLAIYVNRDSHFLAEDELARGTPQSMTIELRSLFSRAIDLNAQGFLLAHNHPSGCASPSQADEAATVKIAEVAAALKLNFIDHIIVTKRQAFSMRKGAVL